MAIEYHTDQDYPPDHELEDHVPVIGREDDETSGYSSDSSILDEVQADDFPSYFEERGGRLFHSHGSSPYPLPADTPEQERLNVTHNVLRYVIGANYVGPIREVLSPEPGGREKLAIDLCTGTGKWVVEMARDFPHVQFRGIDIVPIATRYPPANAQFEVHDVNEPCRWSNGAVDLIHARNVSMAIHSMPRLVNEIRRLLRPGGLFLSCEFSNALYIDGRIPHERRTSIYGATNFFHALRDALATFRGIRLIADELPCALEAAPGFAHITAATYVVPVGAWHSQPQWRRIGRAYRAALLRYAESTKPFLRDAGWAAEDLDRLVGGLVHDLSHTDGLVAQYFTVHARRA